MHLEDNAKAFLLNSDKSTVLKEENQTVIFFFFLFFCSRTCFYGCEISYCRLNIHIDRSVFTGKKKEVHGCR